MISRKGNDFDVILVSGEYWNDHPLSPVGVIARVLEAKGFSVGIIEKPQESDDFTRLGEPRLFFGITSGSIDSMVHNYTPLKRKREADGHSSLTPIPDRAVIVYCNGIKRQFKGLPVVIGGIEASLRRFAHYDYWDNKVRRSIMLDSRADILVYGNGELQVQEIASRLDAGEELAGIPGTCTISKDLPDGFKTLPRYADVKDDGPCFCDMQVMLDNGKDLAQGHGGRYVLQNRYPEYTSPDLDWIYSLPFSRRLNKASKLGMAEFSVVTHRGCIGECSFCSLALHQGRRIISRSKESILAEIRSLTRHPRFKGYIDDLGGPSANMYGMDCQRGCEKGCLGCKELDMSHSRSLELLREARSIPGVKKIFIRSGIRYDLAMCEPEYVIEVSRHHVSGTLKIAPEHFSPRVLALMNKDNDRFDEFLELFGSANKGTGQTLRYYFMIGHPGDDLDELGHLLDRIRELSNVEQFQVFTPTPMTPSTCMYWTGLDPGSREEIKVVRDYNTKKRMKRAMLAAVDGQRSRPSK